MYGSKCDVRRYKFNTKFPRRMQNSKFFPPRKPAILHSKKTVTSEETLDVDIVGFRQIVKPNSTSWWKLSWIVLSVGMLLGCAYQCGERVMHYFSDPSEVNTYFVRNKTITLPSLTICPFTPAFSPFKPERRTPFINAYLLRERVGFEDVQKPIEKLFVIKNMTMDDIWNVSKLNIREMLFLPDVKTSKSFANRDAEKNRISEVDTVPGRCLSFKAKSNIKFPGLQNTELVNVKGVNNFLKGYTPELKNIAGILDDKLYWHTHDDVSMIKYAMLYNNKFFAHSNNNWELFFRVSEVIYRNTKQNPCETDNVAANKCLVDCIEENIYSNLTRKCRLPYMQESSFIPSCTTFEELHEVLAVTVAVMEDFNEDGCTCPRKCRETIYSLQYISPSPAIGQPADVVAWYASLSHREITVTREVATYNGFALFSDLGGSIGLYLGISALQIFEIVLILFKKKTSKVTI